MKKKICQVIVILFYAFWMFWGMIESEKGERSDLSVDDLKVDYVINPIGLDNKKPLFSWKLDSNDYGVYQKAYQIKVYEKDLVTDQRNLVWNSGKVRSSQTINISYEGKELQNSCEYEWQLTVWDENNYRHDASEKGVFETAFMDRKPFENCKFIAVRNEDLKSEGLPVFLKNFTVEKKKIKKAYFYGSALGIYDAYINGKRIGGISCEELKPGWTNYNKSLLYNTYDITELLKNQTEFRVAVMVSNGWCMGEIAHETYQYDRPQYIGKILVIYEDGTWKEIVTDSSWEYFTDTAVESADIYAGEVYNANKYSTRELSEKVFGGGYNKNLKQSKLYDNDELNYFSWYGRKAAVQKLYSKRAEETLPIQIKKNETIILDMKQNMTALPYMRVDAPKGTEIILEFAEMLNDTGEEGRGNDGPAGTLYRENLRSASARVKYIADGKIGEYQSVFTYFGYRYVSITPNEDITVIDFESKFVGIADEPAGTIETDNDKINQLFQNIQWSQRDNWLLVATDCPQRDERLPWTGDLQIFCKTSLYNDELFQFYTKWCRDAIDSQMEDGTYPNIIPYNKVTGTGSAGWGDAGIIIPYQLYHHYQNKQFITMMYPSMKKYMKWLEGSKWNGANPVYGDWLSYESTDKVFVAIAYYAQDALYMSEMAAAIGESADAAYYMELYEKIKTHFQKRYVREGHLTEKSQTACVLALYMKLVDGEVRTNVRKDLRKYIENNGYRLSTGFIGTSLLLKTLSINEMGDLAYRLLLQENHPSWLYSVNQGATTIWERWDSYTKEYGFSEEGMNSFNHFSYGCVGQWMYESMLGIEYDPVLDKEYQFLFAPEPINDDIEQSGISECSGNYNSPLGCIDVSWKKKESGIVYQMKIPANTRAKVILCRDTLGKEVFVKVNDRECTLKELEENGYMQNLQMAGEEISFLLISGVYEIK